MEANKKLSYDEEKVINDEIGEFLNEIGKTDQQLLQGQKDQGNKVIFGDESAPKVNQKSQFAEELEKKKVAENERLKGNECMKSRDYNEALVCYSKSIELHPDEAATYSNRAMSYIKLKDFGKAIEDANKAIKLKPDYLKAYHRRATSYSATNKLDLAIRDYQFILEKEPENKEAIKDLMAVREKLNEKLDKPKKNQEQ